MCGWVDGVWVESEVCGSVVWSVRVEESEAIIFFHTLHPFTSAVTRYDYVT